MPQVHPLEKPQAAKEAQPLLAAVEKRFGVLPNIFGTMAHQPKVLEGVAAIDEGIHQDLPAKLRELAYYKASRVNRCGYCSHHHRKAAEQAGLSQEQIAAVDCYEDSDLFCNLEKRVLSYAEQLTRYADVDPDTRALLRGQLTDQQLVTLAATVALANFTNRFNHALEIELP